LILVSIEFLKTFKSKLSYYTEYLCFTKSPTTNYSILSAYKLSICTISRFFNWIANE